MASRTWSDSTEKWRPQRPKQMARNQPNGCMLQNLQHCHELPYRLYTLLSQHGVKSQFSASPNVRCCDGLFTLKTLTQRKENNQESFVLFMDFVKAYDTANHELLIEILEQYSPPPKIFSVIKRMYTDLTVPIPLDGKSAEIPQTVRVCQGDNLSPFLFLFYMSAFA